MSRAWPVAVLLGLAAAAAPMPGGPAAEERQDYVLGVFPYLPPARLERGFAPVARALGEAAGVRMRLRTRGSFASFREALADGRFDLVFIQPFDYVRVAAPAGYRPLARWDGRLRAVVVTRADSALHGLEGLRGRQVAMPPPAAAVSILGRDLLAARGLAGAVRIVHLRNHFACLSQVAARRAAACVTAASALRVYRARYGAPLEVLSRSEGIPTSLYAAHRRVPQRLARAWQRTITAWHRTPAGRRLLEGIGFRRFVPAQDAEYDAVRAIWRRVQEEGR